MTKETINGIKIKAYEELLDYMQWVCKNYPEVHMEYMLRCPKCNKKFINAVDSITKKVNPCLWKPNCKCLSKDWRLSVG